MTGGAIELRGDVASAQPPPGRLRRCLAGGPLSAAKKREGSYSPRPAGEAATSPSHWSIIAVAAS